MTHPFFDQGWYQFGHDPVLADWVERTVGSAREAVAAPENARWWRCGGTWFAGVNVLGNDAAGAVADGPPLAGRAVDFIGSSLGLSGFAWDSAQLSVCHPGYPQPTVGEPDAAFRYRLSRDAAHLDGIGRTGSDARRFLSEPHAFILGIQLAEASPDAAPLVVWEGSHAIVRAAFGALYAGTPSTEWGAIDATEVYHATRRQVFEGCRRVEVAARPGEATLVHRLALHGVAPWAEAASAGPDGRIIAYFRPVLGGPQDWLERA